MSSDNKDSRQLLDNTVGCRAGISLPAAPKPQNDQISRATTDKEGHNQLTESDSHFVSDA